MAPVIGIDLGTTFSCASVYRRGRPELIPNSEGDRLIPSIVYFDPRTGSTCVGKAAIRRIPRYPKNGLLDAKRLIGRKYDDEFVKSYVNSNQSPFSVVRGNDDQAAYEITVADKKVIKKPEEISAEVLRYLKITASDYLGERVTQAVISVPAYFSNAQRKATKTAAELAGLQVLKLITEPTAAAIHYISDRERNNSKLLAFDLGGGTLDVSLINVNNHEFEVKAVYGDTFLGGRNFDEILFEHFYKKFLADGSGKLGDKLFKERVNEVCIELKKGLSTEEECTLFLNCYGGNSNLNLHMTRKEFEEICKDIFERIMDVIQICLEDSGMTKSDIDQVILVGGSTRIPRLRELLRNYFGEHKIQTDLNPDEAVAAGASIHAAVLLEQSKDLEKYKVTEVTPMSLGIEVDGKLMSVFIPKNSSLPAERTHVCYTTYNNQDSVTFDVYEGERTNVAHNNKLGQFSIEHLPRGRAGDVKFSVSFSLDMDGILSVTATEKSTGESNQLVVTMGQFRLSEQKIKTTLEDARKNKTEDAMFEQFVSYRSDLQLKCRHVVYELDKISAESDRNLVKKASDEFLKESAKLDFKQIEKLEKLFQVYTNSIENILKFNNLHDLLLFIY